MYDSKVSAYWNGRVDSEVNEESFRLHQVVTQKKIDELEHNAADLVLMGFVCEEGVRRNQGRLGAAQGPNALRKGLASLPKNDQHIQNIVDVGNIVCEGQKLEQAQQQLGDAVQQALQTNAKCIVLGGGHETLYGHYLGVRAAYGQDAKIGLVNIDAHFDLRSYDEQPSSGTMFKQILDEDANASYFVCGIQRYGNTTELFNRADKLGVTYLYEDEMTLAEVSVEFDRFANECDIVLLTLCTDVIESAHAPGVSAPSPFGLHPKMVRSIIQLVTQHKKTTSFNICEVNPALDSEGITVKLGAYLTNEAMIGITRGK